MTKAILIGFITVAFSPLILSSNYHEDFSSEPRDNSNKARDCVNMGRVWGPLVECCCTDEAGKVSCEIVMRDKCP